MSTLKKLMNSVKILAICAVLVVGLFAPSAMADMRVGPIPIKGGSFNIHSVGSINQQTVRSAIVALEPANETGTIEAIVITGPEGERELGCPNLKVENGIDLIQSCGGPAVLKAGETTYMAKGSGFDPNSEVILSVNLKP